MLLLEHYLFDVCLRDFQYYLYTQYNTHLYISNCKYSTYVSSPPSLVFCGLRHAEAELLRGEGGGDVPKLEPKRLDFRSVDKIVRDLRRIYKENPALFDIPTFAQKQY